MKDRIAKSFFWVVWSRGAVQLFSFLSTIMVARLLSPSDYGLMALVGIWTSTIALLAEMGLGATIIQFRDLKSQELNACFWITMGVAGSGYLLLFIAAPSLAVWFQSPLLADTLRVAGLALPFTVIRIVPDSLLRKRLALDKVSQAEIAAAFVTIPIVVVMAWAGMGVWALVAGALANPMVQSLVTFWCLPWWPGIRMGSTRLHEILRFSLATLGSRVSYALYQQADSFVLGKVSGDVVLGLYSMAKQLATLPVTKISVVLNQLALPVMAELQDNRGAMGNAFLRIIRLIACITLPVCIGFLIIAEDLIKLVLTEKWAGSVPLVQILCFYAVVRSIDVLFPPVLLARYRANFMFGYTAALLTILPVAFWTGAEWAGAVGVAIVWAAIYPLVMLWMVQTTLTELGLTWATLWGQLWPPLVSTIAMVGATTILQQTVFAWWPIPALGRIMMTTVIGGGAYVAVLSGVGRQVWGEIREVAGWLIRRPQLVTEVKG